MQEARLAPRINEFDSGEGDDLGYLATKSILKSGESMTALFAGDDAVAVQYQHVGRGRPAERVVDGRHEATIVTATRVVDVALENLSFVELFKEPSGAIVRAGIVGDEQRYVAWRMKYDAVNALDEMVVGAVQRNT